MAQAQLRVYFGPEPEAAPCPAPNTVSVPLGEILPLLADGVDVPARTLFWRFGGQGGRMRAVRRDNWKFLVDQDAQFLFDLDADISERRNQFSRHPEIANELREEFVAWAQSLQSAGR